MSTRQSNAALSREKLLAAAMEVIQAKGMMDLTLDAVAKAAGISKGGLLHHFPSKNALLEGILQQLLTDFETQAQAFYDSDAVSRGRWLRAYVRATFADAPLPYEMITLLLLAIPHHPTLLSLIQQDFQKWEARLQNDGLPPARAQVIQQAADGYWLTRLTSPLPAETSALVAELLRLIDHD